MVWNVTDLHNLDSLSVRLSFRLSIPVRGMTIILMDLNGRILSETLMSAREQGDQQEELIVHSKLSAGMYFIQFRSEQTMFSYPITIK